MILAFLSALAAPTTADHATLGHRLDADGVGGAVALSEQLVLGPDGGLAVTTLHARYATEKWVGQVILPFATYRTNNGRTTGLGNLRMEGFTRFSKGSTALLAGFEAHLPTGSTYSFAHDAASLWPGGGVSAVLQTRTPVTDTVDVLGRGSLGVYGTGGVAPFPSVFPHAVLAGGVDVRLPFDLSVLGEASLAVWDPSPIDLAGWVRWQPVESLRIGGGLLLPLGNWAGASPGAKPSGIREATLMFDLGLAL